MPVRRRSTVNTSSDSDHEAKRPRLKGLDIFKGLSIFVIRTEIEPSELEHLCTLAEYNGADVHPTIEQADVVVTRISTQERLERHLEWNLAVRVDYSLVCLTSDANHVRTALQKKKAIVTPAWVTQSVSKRECLPFREHAAVEGTEEHGPDHNPQASTSASVSPLTSSKTIHHTCRFAVQRLSPLVCINQGLLAQLDVIREARHLEGEERSAMSYARSMAAIKAFPEQIKLAEQVAHLPFVGPKTLSMIRQYTTMGHISESSHILNSSRHRCLMEFSRIHGIGPSKARELYDAGCRTYKDLDRRFGAEYGERVSAGAKGETAGIRTMLELRDDMSVPILREEVEEISRVIAQELEVVEPGCKHTICGGYRRGKLQCNDVDFVFTHPQSGKDRNLCKKLVDRLTEKGLVTHILHLSSFRSSHVLHEPASASKSSRPHWDTLDKSLTVFRLPTAEGSTTPPLHRRVDIICTPIETYWTAVVGWTGSTMFERDLRLWAKEKMGLKFDSSGITRRRDTKLLFPMSEKAVFEVLGLEWIDPTMRNADL